MKQKGILEQSLGEKVNLFWCCMRAGGLVVCNDMINIHLQYMLQPPGLIYVMTKYNVPVIDND